MLKAVFSRRVGWRGAGVLLAAVVLAGCTLLPVPPAGLPCIQAPAGLIGWWQGEGDGADAAGTNIAALENGVAFGAGIAGRAFRFDGVDDYAAAPGKGIDELQQLTVEAWVRLSSPPAGRAATFVALGREKAVLRYDGLTPGRPFLEFAMKLDGEPQQITADGTFQAGVYHHVAGTYDGSVMRLYLDGAQVGSQAAGGRSDPGSGIALGGPAEPLEGLLDEIAIYDRALTSSEIRAIFQAGTAGKCPVDDDYDGIPTIRDNCPYHANADQADADHDGRGDRCEIEHVVVLDIDGLRADVLAAYLASPDSEGGVLREITARKIEASAATILPPVTFAAQASLFTGVFPAKHGITGNEWLDRTVADPEDRSRSYTATSVFALNDVVRVYGYAMSQDQDARIVLSAVSGRDGLANRDLQAKTIYEYACEAGRRSVVSFTMFWKGLAWEGDASSPCGDYLGPQPQDLWEWAVGNSRQYEVAGSVRRLLNYLDAHEVPDLVTLYLPGLDHESHSGGIVEQARYLQWYDRGAERPLGRVVDKLKEKGAYDNTVFVIVADHGQSDVGGDDAHSILLEDRRDQDKEIEEVIENEFGDIYDHFDENEFDSFAGFNGGVLQIYLKNRGRADGEPSGWREGSLPNPPDFWTDVLPAVRAINRHRCGIAPGGVTESGELCENGEDAVEEVLVKDGSGRYEILRPVGDSPADPACAEQFDPSTGASTGFVLCPLSLLPSLHPEYVDPVRRIEGLSHTRSGDILLLAAWPEGYHFSEGSGFSGLPKAEHGSLYPGDSAIPFVIAGKPLDRSITVAGQWSIVDVAPTIADLLGFYRGIEDRFDGESILGPGF